LVTSYADPAVTLRWYGHAIPAEEADLSFAEFGRGSTTAIDAPGRPYAAPRSKTPQEPRLDNLDEGEGNTSESEGFVERETGGPGQNRTGDTRIFSAVLYQLSYRASSGRRI
jgi:hypothetical protein